MPHLVSFPRGSGKRGGFQQGIVEEWDWCKLDGGYDEGVGFFSVHWEIHDWNPDSIRLHVESPAISIDSELNSIKVAIIKEVIASSIRNHIIQKGYEFRQGTKILQTETNKSTEAFRVVLQQHQKMSNHEDNMKLVHNLAEHLIHPIIMEFSQQLDHLFKVVRPVND
jgi:hypothetical protein